MHRPRLSLPSTDFIQEAVSPPPPMSAPGPPRPIRVPPSPSASATSATQSPRHSSAARTPKSPKTPKTKTPRKANSTSFPEVRKELQSGARGGTFYVTKEGKKVYLKRKFKLQAIAAATSGAPPPEWDVNHVTSRLALVSRNPRGPPELPKYGGMYLTPLSVKREEVQADAEPATARLALAPPIA